MDKSAQRYIDLAFEYHVAAMALNSQIFDAPYLYNPTAYLLRHTIELLLKGLIINEKKRKNHISIKEIKVGKKNINAQHSLLSLWAHLNKLASPAFEKSDIALIRSVISAIKITDMNAESSVPMSVSFLFSTSFPTYPSSLLADFHHLSPRPSAAASPQYLPSSPRSAPSASPRTPRGYGRRHCGRAFCRRAI